MTINIFDLTVRDLANNYKDSGENGVTGFNGKLNIRPAYQREFVYGPKERDAVIRSIVKGFPLGTFYWAKNDNSDSYELLDGQQRTISICQFVNNEFSIEFESGTPLYFRNIENSTLGQNLLNYKLFTYICSDGDDKEKLDWFRTINIAGVKLTEQELLNATYTGTFLESAKRFFSRNNCPAYILAKKYVKGSPIRQDFLETALSWISNDNIAEYMAQHQHDTDASSLISDFTNTIDIVKSLFPNYRKEMLGLNWGELIRKYNISNFKPEILESKISSLMANDEVTDKKGIYEYVLSNEDESVARKLSKRTFTSYDMRTVYEKQNGICPICGEHHDISEMQGDHIIPWWRGGKTTIDNLQMLCVKCNSGKAGKMKI